MQKFLALAAVVLVSATISQADDDLNYAIHQPYISIRALGSGNSFSVIDDYNALLYNPAVLARLQEGEMNFGFGGAVTTSTLGFSSDITDASKASEAEKVQKVQEVLDKNYGKNFALRFPTVNAFWTRPKWGVGLVLADTTVNLSVHQTGGPQLATSAYVDNTIAFGMAKNFLENDALAVGATVKGVYRGYVGKSFNAFDLATDPSFFKPKDAEEGLTIDLDLGTEYTLTPPEEGTLKFLKYAKPTFSFVVRNVLDYGFKQNMHLLDKNSGNEPPKLGRRFDFGSKWQGPDFWVFTPRLMFDIRDVGHRYWTFLKGLHTGIELEWKPLSWLKGHYSFGLGQGYISGGIGAQLAWFRLDAATYGEEIGTSKAKKENRFYIAKLSLDL